MEKKEIINGSEIVPVSSAEKRKKHELVQKNFIKNISNSKKVIYDLKFQSIKD